MRLNREQLYELAHKHELNRRSDMGKDEPAKAIRNYFENRTQSMTKQELYDEARERDIDGRSQMDKDQMADAVKKSRQGDKQS